MYIKRYLNKTIINQLKNTSKAIILYGARQTGKTTLVKEIIKELDLKTLFINADESKYLDIFSSRSLEKMKSVIHNNKMLVIDEAQRIPNIGINLKILIDSLPYLKIIATGSSSFELANQISEPLTGRVWTHTLFPLSNLELTDVKTDFDIIQDLENQLIFGLYPEVYSIIGINQKKILLETITQSYLYKDAFELMSFKQTDKIKDILKLLSFQVGQEVSVFELSNRLGVSRELVDRYLYLLEKSFVVFKLSGLSRNLRKEVYQKSKYYFYDLGVRNALIDNLKPISDRDDVGRLWENFLMIERKKYLSYKQSFVSTYFWRTYTGAELDYVEEKNGKLYGFEFKYSDKKAKIPASWKNTYKEQAKFKLINRQNYLPFIK